MNKRTEDAFKVLESVYATDSAVPLEEIEGAVDHIRYQMNILQSKLDRIANNTFHFGVPAEHEQSARVAFEVARKIAREDL